jgi:RNA polymerase sigma factor (sigma-70 family)
MPARPERLLRYLRRLAPRPASHPASDGALLERFARCRDEDAFAALLARHGPMVLGTCRRTLGDAHAAEDAAQATFLVLARRAAAVRPPERLAAWLYGVARHLALKCRRADARRRQREGRLRAEPARPSPDPLAEVSARELLLLLDAEVERLPEVYRLPVLLCGLEGLSQEEAARRLGWTPGSLKGRLERGRARLHARLARRGIVLSAALAAAAVARAGVAGRWSAPTAKAAVLVAAGRPAAGVVSGEVIALSEGVLKAMLRTRLILPAALLALVVLGAGAGVFAFRAQGPEKSPPAGEAAQAAPAEPDVYALLVIEAREPRVLPDAKPAAAEGEAGAYRRTQAALLKSRPVVQAALKRPEVAGLAVLKGQADPVAWLEKNLRTAFLDGSGVLRVSVAEGRPAERAALLNAVVRSYLDEVVEAERQAKVRRVEQLEKLATEHQHDVQAHRRTLRELTEWPRTASSLEERSHREDLAGFRQELQRVRLAKVRAQARLNYLKRTAGATAKEVVKLEEEVGTLVEQEKLLREEIEPLVKAEQDRPRPPEGLAEMRAELAAAEQFARRMAEQLQAARVELAAPPRVRLLQQAEAPRAGK